MALNQIPSRKLEDNPELIDEEEDTSSSHVATPWDPASIRITTKNFSLREVVEQINEGEIELAPEFQRGFVWKERQRTRLIESILLGIPLPAFYFDQAEDGTYTIVDGVQRLSTIKEFMGDRHTLQTAHLEYLKDLNGRTYSALEGAIFRRFRSTQIVVHVIEPQTPVDVKYDIFNRVNTLGSPLSAQEIRHAMSKSRSRTFLGQLAESEEFDVATNFQYWRQDRETGAIERDGGRMTNRELALRFCAFRNYSEDNYRRFSSLDAYLINFTNMIDGVSGQAPLSEVRLKSLEADFRRAMVNAKVILDEAAFRRWPLEQKRRGPINRALFEAHAIALADYPVEVLLPFKRVIEKNLRAAFADPQYLRSVTYATGDPFSISYRLDTTKHLLRATLNDS